MSKFFDAVRRANEQAGVDASQLIPDLTPIFGEYGEAAREAEESLLGWAEDQLLTRQGTAVEKSVRRSPVHPTSAAVLVPLEEHDHRAADEYRLIRTKIVQYPQRPRLIAVSSSGTGDGKTVTAINVAAALSLKEKSAILLADADFRRSALAEVLGIEASPGLADVLRGACSVRDAVVQLETYPNLYVLPGGSDLPNAVDLLDSPRWQLATKIFSSQFDHTIIDAPPVGLAADYDLIQAAVDAVLLVARTDHTNRARFLETIRAIPQRKLLGLVMNCAR